ncbi:MAG: hypothetical protein ABR568_16450 [Pyrinomonadaceae bacterium]
MPLPNQPILECSTVRTKRNRSFFKTEVEAFSSGNRDITALFTCIE